MLQTNSQVIGAFADAALTEAEVINEVCFEMARRYAHLIPSALAWIDLVDRLKGNTPHVSKAAIAQRLRELDDNKKLTVWLDMNHTLRVK